MSNKPTRQARRDPQKPTDFVTEAGAAVKSHRQVIVKAIESMDALGAGALDEEWIIAYVDRDARELFLTSVFGHRTGLYPARRATISARIDLHLKQNDDLSPEYRLGLLTLCDAVLVPLACGHRSMFLALTLGEQICCPICDYDVLSSKREN